jgi:DNA-binding MarR family transcriptional regulator
LVKATDNNTARNEKNSPADYIGDNNVWWLLDNAKSAISRLRDMELAKINITPEQAAILTILAKGDKSTITEISEYWLRQRNSVSTLINRMEKQGLVKKIKYPHIKELEIVITPKGQSLNSRITRQSVYQVFEVLSVEEKQVLAHYLKLLAVRSRSLLGASLDLYFLK